MRKYLAVLKNPNFALLWAGQGVSDIGSQINFIALTLLVVDLTGDVMPVSLLFIALTVPSVLLGPWAGVLVDRWNKKAVIILSDVIRGGLAIAMAFAPNLGWIYVLAMAQAAVTTFFSPAIRTVIPRLVAKEQLLTANALASATNYISRLAGPALGGLVAGLFGVQMAFVANGVSFLVSALSECWIKVPQGAGESSVGPGLGRDFREGVRYILGNRAVKFVIIFFFVAMLPPMGGLNILQVVLLREVFAYSETSYGLLMTFYGVGLLVGAAIIGRFENRSELRLMVGGMGLYGLAYLTLIFGRTFVLAAATLITIGLFATVVNVSYTTFLQKAVADEMRGRIFSIDIAASNAAWLISVAITGLLADAFGVKNMIALAGAMLVALVMSVRQGTVLCCKKGAS